MKYIYANWKMYLDFDESNIVVNQLIQKNFNTEKVEVVLFPPSIAIADSIKATVGGPILIGAQDVAWADKGAYTGAISARMYKDLGCSHAIVGHSERRYIFGETNEDVRKKIEACLDIGLVPVLCIGETADDKENNKTEYRLKKQLLKALDGLDINKQEIIIAYEPVWAIGSGEPCDPIQVDETCMWIQNQIKQYTCNIIPILYGGSVNEKNVVTYLASKNIQGVLVGSVSTKFDLLFQMILSAEKI